MTKYFYKNGKRYKVEEDNGNSAAGGIAVVVGVALLVGFVSGMAMTSLFASLINGSWRALWAVLFGTGIFFPCLWAYKSLFNVQNPMKRTIWTYLVTSFLSGYCSHRKRITLLKYVSYYNLKI